LPGNTVFWIQGKDPVTDRLKGCEEELQYFLAHNATSTASIEEEDADKFFKKDITTSDFITADTFVGSLQHRSVAYFGDQCFDAKDEYAFHTKSQPAFNRQFNLLIEDLKDKENKQYSIYIFSENPKQLQRLQTIFDDLNAGLVFNPVACSIHLGFVDEDLKIVCYTDHEIFQRYHKYKVKQAYNKNKSITLRTLRELQQGDYVTHNDHGVGVYSGLQKIEVNGKQQEVVRIIYKD